MKKKLLSNPVVPLRLDDNDDDYNQNVQKFTPVDSNQVSRKT